MAFINEYPYSDFNEYNLDWVVKNMRDLLTGWADMREEWSGVKTDWEAMTEDFARLGRDFIDFKDYVTHYLQNLDVQQEINNKLDQMALDGYFADLFVTLFTDDVQAQAAATTSAWIADNLLQETGYVIDNSLTVGNAAADAEATGNAINEIKTDMNYLACNYERPVGTKRFQKKIAALDNLGYNPQGIAVLNNTAYVTNGYTAPMNVIGEVDLTTGLYTNHTVTGYSTHGGNSATIDPETGYLYVSEHNWPNPNIYIIDTSDFTLVDTIATSGLNDSNIIGISYDPRTELLYLASYSKVTVCDKEFNVKRTITIDRSNMPTKKGTDQGFCFDGKYFYYPQSGVQDYSINEYIYIYDLYGNFVESIRGLMNEIEDLAYDFTNGEMYVSYAGGASLEGYIAKFVADSGWINLIDIISINYPSYGAPTNIDADNTTAAVRVKDGFCFFKGKITVNSYSPNMGYTLFFMPAYIDIANNEVIVAKRTATPSLTDVGFAGINMSAFNQYITPETRYLYYPVQSESLGTFWLDSLCLPMGRAYPQP